MNAGILSHLANAPGLAAIAIGFVASLYIVWRILGAAIKALIFAVSFAVGFGVAYGLGALNGHPQALWVYAAEGLAFAWVVSLIRAKIARAIAGFVVLGIGQLTGWFGFAPKPQSPAKAPPPHHSHRSPHPKSTQSAPDPRA